MILVTGGTGLLGAHLLASLAQQHTSIRATYRTRSKLEQVRAVFSFYNCSSLFETIEWVEADITNIPNLDNTFKNVTHVYHCAGYISFDPKEFNTLKKINIEGTANIVNLCLTHNIKKLCHVSSIATLGTTTKEPISENTYWNPEAENSVYAITKYGAEMEVWRGSREGLDVIIVNPGVILGTGFWKSASSSIFGMLYNGFSYYTTGTSGYILVNDVTNAMITLMKSSIINENYILVAKNYSVKEITQTIAKKLNVKAPYKEAKPWLLKIGWRLDWLKSTLLNTPRKLTKVIANTAFDRLHYSNEKIKNELNFQFSDVDTGLDRICKQFLQDHSKK